jgi:transcriptional regulator with XRE-family HTH domain
LVKEDLSFGEWLGVTRRRQGLTQKKLADLIHQSQANVSSWENGKSYPSLLVFEWDLLCKALGCLFEDIPRDQN